MDRLRRKSSLINIFLMVLVLTLIVIMSMGVFVGPSVASADSPAIIALENKNVIANTPTVAMGVYARGVPEPGLCGYNFQITYSPTVVDFVYIFGTNDFSPPTFYEAQKGTINVVAAQPTGKTGDIHLFDLSFKSIASTGSTLVNLQVYDNDFLGYSLGDDFPVLPYNIESGNISLGKMATLSDLKVDGATVPGFSADGIAYNQELPMGTTTIPLVTATATDPKATVNVTQAVYLTGAQTDRTATVSVTAADGLTKTHYTVTFSVATPPAFQSALADPSNKILTLYFDKPLVDNTGGYLKAKVTLARDGLNYYSPLGINDAVVINGNSLIIALNQALTGGSNIICIAPQALKDKANHVLPTDVSASVAAFDECFIATAAYGSKYQPAVALLREFRNKYLLTNSLGKSFVQFYYRHSPPIAGFIAGNEILKFLIRISLTPIIVLVYLIFHPVLPILGLVAIVGILILRRKSILKTS
ncbi:MAG: CFI-box-CTERM domain-containing protein [Desulfosporosinus sp.]